AAESANCVDFCSPCYYLIGEFPAPEGCGCTIDPSDPNLAQFPGFQPIACIDPSYNVVVWGAFGDSYAPCCFC
ncbi:MAG TPA: hypothetical protein VK667_03105, partial [Ktedonobacteraceae bacterium]|nr:hypothetical protein [Ktedonobacteraceae bacterium]